MGIYTKETSEGIHKGVGVTVISDDGTLRKGNLISELVSPWFRMMVRLGKANLFVEEAYLIVRNLSLGMLYETTWFFNY